MIKPFKSALGNASRYKNPLHWRFSENVVRQNFIFTKHRATFLDRESRGLDPPVQLMFHFLKGGSFDIPFITETYQNWVRMNGFLDILNFNMLKRFSGRMNLRI